MLVWFFIVQVALFKSAEVSRKDKFLALFSLFVYDLIGSLPTSISCFFYADGHAIWSSSSLVPTAAETSQGASQRVLI